MDESRGDSCERKRRRRKPRKLISKKGTREMKLLYVSLKEIPWAQHWSPKTFLGGKERFTHRIIRRDLESKLDKSNDEKPSSIYAKFYPPKRTVKVTNSISPMKTERTATTILSKKKIDKAHERLGKEKGKRLKRLNQGNEVCLKKLNEENDVSLKRFNQDNLNKEKDVSRKRLNQENLNKEKDVSLKRLNQEKGVSLKRLKQGKLNKEQDVCQKRLNKGKNVSSKRLKKKEKYLNVPKDVLSLESECRPMPSCILKGKPRGQISIKKFIKQKDMEKGLPIMKNSIATLTLEGPVLGLKVATIQKPDLTIHRNEHFKVEGLCDQEQRTKSVAVRFDFVSKLKKSVVTDQNTAVEVRPAILSFPHGKTDLTDAQSENAKASKSLDNSFPNKGKCMVKCIDNQKCCQESNSNIDTGMTILDTLLQKKDLQSRKRKPEEDVPRSSVRQSECAFRYKEIAVKKHRNYIQIILLPNNIRRNSLTLEALRELKEAFLSAQKDPTCKVVLLNSSGKYFCTGLDLSPLLGPDKDKAATVLADTVKSFVETLALLSKPLVAAVNGKAVGFGVGLLPFCDVVLASDKATFSTPYARLGYIPEAAATLTMPQVVGSTWAMNMLLRSQKLTAIQAHNCGLVTEVLWPSKFMEEVIPRVREMASQSLQVMEATKVMMRCHQWEKLQAVLQTESRLLSKQWLTPQCQKSIREMMTNDDLDS